MHTFLLWFYFFPRLFITGGKMSTWEGGIRIPGIIRWPGHIRPGTVSNDLTSQLDFFPTIMKIVGGKMPTDRPIDGLDISRILFKWRSDPEPKPEPVSNTLPSRFSTKTKPSPEEDRLLVFHCRERRFAARYGSYKFHFISQDTWTKEENGAKPSCGDGGFPIENNVECGDCWKCSTEHDPPLMYNVDKDPREAYPLNTTLAVHRAVLDKMLVKLEEFESGLVIAPPLLDSRSTSTIPCCTPETFPVCTCNYTPPTPPYPDTEGESGKFEQDPPELDLVYGTIFD